MQPPKPDSANKHFTISLRGDTKLAMQRAAMRDRRTMSSIVDEACKDEIAEGARILETRERIAARRGERP